MIESTYELIDVDQWKRKEIYTYFLSCEEPFHGVTVRIDMTLAKEYCQENKVKIFDYYMYNYLRAVNNNDAFRLRILGNKVVRYHEIHSGITVMKEDETFAYGHLYVRPSLSEFSEHLHQEKYRVRSRNSLKDKEIRQDMIHFSVLPWTDFYGLSHARRYGTNDSIPKITFGKIVQEGHKFFMPLSVHVHHALVDGKDVANFIDDFQDLINNK